MTIGFDVDHKTSVSNSGCQLTNGKLQTLRTASSGEGHHIGFQGRHNSCPTVCNNDGGAHLELVFGAITRPTRGQQAARSEGQLTVQSSLIFYLTLFFHTQNKPSFFLRFFVVFFCLRCCSVAFVVMHFCCVQHYLIRTAILFRSPSLSLFLYTFITFFLPNCAVKLGLLYS